MVHKASFPKRSGAVPKNCDLNDGSQTGFLNAALLWLCKKSYSSFLSGFPERCKVPGSFRAIKIALSTAGTAVARCVNELFSREVYFETSGMILCLPGTVF